MQDSNIKVSVCVVTYNQEKYIGECLDSLVLQQTNFPFEIIVGDDASSDRTPEIIQEYYEKYPDIIIPVLRDKNLGPVGNIIDIYKMAKGGYIAHLDGDDMALPGKLQAQANALDANPDCSICAHSMSVVDAKSKQTRELISFKGKYQLLDLYLINPFIIHSSKMFVNKIHEYIHLLDKNALDLEVHIYQAYQGEIIFLPEILGVYREFVGVTYNSAVINPLIPMRIQYIYDNIQKNSFASHELQQIYHKYAYILLQYANHYVMKSDYEEAFKYVTKSGKVRKCFSYYFFRVGLITPRFLKFILSCRSYLLNTL